VADPTQNQDAAGKLRRGRRRVKRGEQATVERRRDDVGPIEGLGATRRASSLPSRPLTQTMTSARAATRRSSVSSKASWLIALLCVIS
jgi:hypothetical protein